MIRIINTHLNGIFYIEKVEPYINYHIVIAKLLDEDKKEICEIYEGENLVELAEQISNIKNIDELVDILELDNAMWGMSPQTIQEQWVNEYLESLGWWEYDEEEENRLKENEIEWFEINIKNTILRVGQTYFIINF